MNLSYNLLLKIQVKICAGEIIHHKKLYIFRKVHIYLDHCYHVCTINMVGQKGFDNKSMFCHRRKVGALFSYLITFVPISNIPITEGMNIILNKNTTAIIVLNYVHFQ